MYRTLQLLSSIKLRSEVKSTPWLACCSLGTTSAMEIRISTVSRRTLSWSSWTRCWNMGIISSTTIAAGISFTNLAMWVAAWRRTMGVSSWTSWPNCWRSCSWTGGETLE
jgi:hypothetical protein